METKYIVVHGEAMNHQHKTNQLDNYCDVCDNDKMKEFLATKALVQGARKVQVFKLVSEYDVTEAVKTTDVGTEIIKLEYDE